MRLAGMSRSQIADALGLLSATLAEQGRSV